MPMCLHMAGIEMMTGLKGLENNDFVLEAGGEVGTGSFLDGIVEFPQTKYCNFGYYMINY